MLLAADLPDFVIADHATDSIRRFDGSSDAPLSEVLPAFVPTGSGGLVDPHDPTFGPDGNLYVFSTAPGAQKILRYDGNDGAFLGTFVDTGAGGFIGGSQMAFGPDGNLYVATATDSGVLRFDGVTGAPLGVAAIGNGIDRACGVAFGFDGNLYVLDADAFIGTSADRVLRFDLDTGNLIDEFIAPGDLDDACLINFGPDGHLYIPDVQFADTRQFSGTTGELLNIFPPGTPLVESPAFEVFWGPDGNGYAATAERILRYDGETAKFLDVLVDGIGGTATFFPVAGSRTDLELVDVQLPTGAVQGKELPIQYTVENQSLVPTASDEWVDVIYLSSDSVFDPDDQEIGRIPHAGILAAGDSYTASLHTTLGTTPTGEFHVLVFTDRRGQVPDPNRLNNLRFSDQPLSIVPPLGPLHDPQSGIAVGRTMSAYTTQDISDGGLTLTYTVYNLLPAPVSGVLLTTALQPGVTLQQASSPPNQNGEELVWNLGNLGPFGSATIEVRVVLDSPSPLLVDAGPRAFAHADGVQVVDELPEAVLRTDVIDPALLAATVDANAADPFIRAKAAELNQDAMEIFEFVRDDVQFEAYAGSLRGARGALWSNAANSLDQASLLAGMLRASGIPARYATGLLDDASAQSLISQMFPENFQAVGLIGPGEPVVDPADDAQLLGETRPHFWTQFDVGAGFVDADPSFANATIGATFAATDGRFSEVPDNLRHKVTVRLDRELAIPALSAFGGGSPLSRRNVLEHTFAAAELVGTPLTIGQFVQSQTLVTPITTSIANNFSPYLAVGDEAVSLDATHLIRGTDFQEFITNFPLGSQVFTGLFLEVDLISPDGSVETHHRTLADRIGFDIRQNGGVPNLLIGADSPSLLSETDTFTLFATASLSNPRRTDALPQQLQSISDRFEELAPDDATGLPLHLNRLASIGLTQVIGNSLLQVSDAQTEQLSETLLVRAYFDKPRLVLVSNRTNLEVEGDEKLELSIDLRRNTIRVVPFPGQSPESVLAYRAARGVFENAHEESIVPMLFPQAFQSGASIGAIQVFEAAEAQGIEPVLLTSQAPGTLETLDISGEAKARLTAALSPDKVFVVPARSVTINGAPTIAWFEINLVTGETIGVTEDGGFQAIAEFAATKALGEAYSRAMRTVQGLLLGVISGSVINTAHALCELGQPNSTECRSFLLAQKEKVRSVVKKLAKHVDYDTFVAAFNGTVRIATYVDPPVPNVWVNPVPGFPVPANVASSDVDIVNNASAGAVSGAVDTSHVKLTGQLALDWASTTPVSLSLTTLNAASATLFDSAGTVVGTGSVRLDGAASALVRGNVRYDVTGRGTLASYASSTSGLGFSAAWNDYAAILSGSATIELSSDALSFDGVLLPSGAYSIVTGLATATGNGPSSSPDFLGTVVVDLLDGAILLGPGNSELQVGGGLVTASQGMALSGFDGSATITAGSTQDHVALSGDAGGVLRVFDTPSVLSADQNAPVTVSIQLETSLTGRYTLQAEAPAGWTVEVSDSGVATLTLPPGLQGGSFPVRLSAQSLTDPSLVAHAEVMLSVSPTAPGVDVDVVADPLLHVPFFGAMAPTAYHVRIHNVGPNTDTYEISVADPPPGFRASTSISSVSVPAGETALVGLYLEPIGALPAPGASFPFQVTAASTNDVGISETEVVPFIVPEIHGLSLQADPIAVATIPGVGVQTVLLLESRGNVAENVSFDFLATGGLFVEGLQPVTLDPGELEVLFLTLTPPPTTPLNSSLSTEIAANFGAPESVELVIPLQVAAPGVTSVAEAATFVRDFLGNTDLAIRLDDLGIALTNLAQTPESDVFKSQAVANLDSILTLLAIDPILVAYVDDFQGPRDELAAATTQAEVLAALLNVGAAMDGFADAVFSRNEFNFELSLLPNSRVALPQVPSQFELQIHHIGGVSQGTYHISLSGLPPSVVGGLSEAQVTLDRDEFASVFVTLTQDAPDELLAFSFRVDVSVDGFPEITKSVVGSLEARDEFVSIVSVAATPPFADAGGLLDVSARVLNTMNRQQQAQASFVVKDAAGLEVLGASPPANVGLTVQTSLLSVPLGTIDTTGLANGTYTIEVTLTDANGQPIPGATGKGSFFVGSPLTASLKVAPEILPPGTSTVTNTLELEALALPPAPLELMGQAAVAGATDVVRNGDFVYVAGTAGVSVFNIAGGNVSNPQLVRVVGTSTNLLRIRGNLLVAARFGNSGKVDTYSLTDPGNPAFLGTTGSIPYGSAADMVLTGSHAFLVIVNFVFNGGNDLVAQNGGLLAINITNPAAPVLDGDAISAAGTPAGRDGVNDGVLFNENGTNNDGVGFNIVDQSGGNQMTWSAVQVAPTILLVTGSSATGSDTENGIGLVRVVDISDPQNMQLIRDLEIPNSVHILDIDVQGEQAIVTGTEGGMADFTPGFPFTGNVVQAILDITDPANPQIVRSETLAREARGMSNNVSLGNGLFAFSSQGGPSDQPGLFAVDEGDPGTFKGLDVPAPIVGLSRQDDLIFTADQSSLIIYRFTTPLKLIGHEPISGGAHGVAARNDVAYACSNDGIKVIDYADPDNPTLHSTVGSGARFGCKIQNDLLLATTSLTGPFVLEVYSLRNHPLSPVLLGSSPGINYRNLLSGLESSSTHAFVTQFQVCWVKPSDDVYVHMGDLISIALNLDDPNNPTSATPALDSVLFNTFGDSAAGPGDISGCPQGGGDHNVFGVAMANPQTAYLAASSVVGGDTQAGVGQVHVVNVTNAATPGVVKNLDLPGTVQAIGIGIDGNVGVVIGSTTGWNDSPFDGLRNGFLTITTLDLTDPLNPVIVAQRTLNRHARTFWTNTGAAGDGRFAFSSLDFADGGNNAELLLIDVSNPRNPLIHTTNFPLDTIPANSISFDGRYLFTADGGGISIHEINVLPLIPVTAEVRVPANAGVEIVADSFNLAPDQIIPGVQFDTLVWNLALTSIEPSQTLTWESTVVDLRPGESREVVLDTVIDFGFQGAPGQLSLPATKVAAEQVLSLIPGSVTSAPGDEALFSIVLANPSSLDVTYDLTVEGLPQEWIEIETPLTVLAGSAGAAILRLTSDPFALRGEYGFVVHATVGGASTSVSGTLVLDGPPTLPDAQPEARGVVVSLTPINATAGQGTASTYLVRATNTGSMVDSFELLVSGLPLGFATSIGIGAVKVPPGATNFVDIPLILTPPIGAAPGEYPFTVTATSTTDATIVDDAAAFVTVQALGVHVSIAPGSALPNSTVEMTVTNTGQVAETFDLSLAGPAALVSTLGSSSVTLNVGQSIVVPIQVGAIDFAHAGSLALTGTATAQTNHAVHDTAEAQVLIGESAGMDATFDPTEVDLAHPGEAAGLLLIKNQGNVEDTYEVSIIQTTGPIVAQLIGLDGRPTQSIPIVRLPGLAIGSLLLQTVLLDSGDGAVTLRITSHSDPGISVDRSFFLHASGVNRPATISGLSNGTATEDAPPGLASGALTVNDPDPGETVFQAPTNTDGIYGTFTFNPLTGSWTYALDNSRTATNGLIAAQIVTDTLTVTSLDGTASQDIVVSITGANDLAMISGVSTGAVTENAASGTVSGLLTVSDPDAGQAKFLMPSNTNGIYGTFSFDPVSGSWTYTLDNSRAATNGLVAGQIVNDRLVVKSLDETATRAIVITISGMNDAAASIHLLHPTACAALNASGNASISVPGAIIVNSNCHTGAISASGNARVQGGSIHVVGTAEAAGNARFLPTPTTGVAVVVDPLAHLGSSIPTGGVQRGSVNCSKGSLTLNPGVYDKLNASGKCHLVLTSGIYVVAGGGINASGNAHVDGSAGILFYNASNHFPATTGSYGGISLSGNATLQLAPISSGTFAGLSIFQPLSNAKQISLSGNATISTMGGIIYVPAAPMSLSGNGKFTAPLIAKTLQASGNGAARLTAGAKAVETAEHDAKGISGQQLVRGELRVSIQDPSGEVTAEQRARLHDAINYLNSVFGELGTTLVSVGDRALADIEIVHSGWSPCGTALDGALGCASEAGAITLVRSSNWYTGSDPHAVPADQYDYQSIVTHELGHALGLEHSGDAASVMFSRLWRGASQRNFSPAELQGLGSRDFDGADAKPSASQKSDLAALRIWTLPAAVGARDSESQRLESRDAAKDIVVSEKLDDLFLGWGRDVPVGGIPTNGRARSRGEERDHDESLLAFIDDTFVLHDAAMMAIVRDWPS